MNFIDLHILRLLMGVKYTLRHALMCQLGGLCIWLSIISVLLAFFSFLQQVTLGISTLLMYVPTPLAATHQSGSLALLSGALWLMNELRRVPK